MTRAEYNLLAWFSWHYFKEKIYTSASVVDTGLTTVTNSTSYFHREMKALITNSKYVPK